MITTLATVFESLIILFNYLSIQNSGRTFWILDYSIQLLINSKLRPHFLNPWLVYSTTYQFKTLATLLIILFNYLLSQNSGRTFWILDYSIQLLLNSKLRPHFLYPWLVYSTTYQFKTPATLLIILFNYLPIQNSSCTLDYSIQLLIDSKLRPHFLNSWLCHPTTYQFKTPAILFSNPWLFYSTTYQFKTPAALFESWLSFLNALELTILVTRIQ